MKKYLLFLTALFFVSTAANSQTWIWTQRITDSIINAHSTNVLPTKVENALTVSDNHENIFVAQGLLFKKTTSPTYDRYVIRLARYDNNGKSIWVKYFENPGLANTGSSRSHVYDIRLDKFGNIYMITRNFTMYDSAQIDDGNTTNCMVKLNANGKLIWKKQIGLIEANLSNQSFCRLAISPHATHIYAYFNQTLLSLKFLDSTYTKPSGQSRFILCKIDSAGRILQDHKFIGVSNNTSNGGFDVTKNDEVIVTGYGTSDITLADTTILVPIFNPDLKSFIAAFNGNNLTRKWTRIITFLSSPPQFSAIMGAVVSANNDIGFLLQIARSGSDFVVAKQMIFGPDTILVQLPNIYENPYLYITDSTGRLKHFNRLSPDSRMLIVPWSLATDQVNNFYTTGIKATVNAQLQERFIPVIVKTDKQVNRLWTNRVTGLDSLTPLPPIVAGMYDYPVMLTSMGYTSQPVFGPDTLSLPNCSPCGFHVLSAIGGKSNTIRGKVFRDYNSNHIQDAGEPNEENLSVTANNGQFNAFTDRLGNYLLVTDSGTHQVTIPTRPRYFGSFPASHSIILNGYNLNASNKNFALTLDTLVQDVSIDVTHIGPARPGFHSTIALTCTNNGTLPASGFYTLKLDPGMTFVQSDSTPIIIANDSIRWNYSTLLSGRQFINNIRVKTEPSVANGSVKKFASFMDPYATDTTKANNRDTAWVTITGSYDPNDKLVYPLHEIRIDSIQSGSKILEYTIRFQNTGTDTAFNIFIADTLSSKLDLTKFRLLSSSHPVELQWKDPGILNFYFHDILLPDSNRNEPQSHGFVKFTILPKTSLSVSDSIFNRASIYFDYNLPVLTNRLSTQFRNNIITPVTNIIRDEYQLSITPNPVVSELYYTICCFPAREKVQLEITDILGRKLLVRSVSSSSRTMTGTINIQHLMPGVYLLRMNGSKGKATLKFIKN